MSSGPPRAVLSDRLQECLASRQVRAAVFLTYRFDPGFFEQEILPTLFDKALSHEPAVRLIQLEDELRSRVEHAAVYYDHGALEAGAESAKLDVQRIPIRWPTGYFHPKVVLLLVDPPLDQDGEPTNEPQSLLYGVLSANLTRAGWWENVEVAHLEEVDEGERSSLRADLLALLRRVRRAAPAGSDHSAAEAIERHLRSLEQRKQMTSNQVLHPRIWCGGRHDSPGGQGSLTDFLAALLPGGLSLNLEVISPYLDETDASGPLKDLVDALAPREVRVHLPTGPDGDPLIPKKVYEAIAKVPGATWARLPKDLLQSGDAEQAAPRRVHAKVYRVFSTRPKNYEAIFVGSVNLTQAGHSKGGNFEAGILLETESPRRLDWWLAADAKKPSRFPEAGEGEDSRSGPGSRLALTYSWNTETGEALWNDESPSPRLRLDAQGSPLFELEPLEPGHARPLAADQAAALAEVLRSTSFVTVRIEGEDDATILVQEEGMAAKPSILLNLSVADILRYWAELNESQKAALLERHYEQLAPAISALMPKAPLGVLEKKSIFDTFAGFFHAFATLERDVFRALDEGREKEAVYRVLGKKHDSLPHLLDRVELEGADLGAVERYVLLLCARQLLRRLEREDPGGFSTAHRAELREIETRIDVLSVTARSDVAPDLGEDPDIFFTWFERWFLNRAEPLEEATT